jgi:hypothetical protein
MTATAPCARCKQPRTLHPAKPEWGRTPSPLCGPCWESYAEARAQGDYVDWNDAFDNASDEQLADALSQQGDAR